MTDQYPVTCEAGKHLDTTCAAKKRYDYEESVRFLAKAFATAMEGVNSVYNLQVSHCNGDATCLSNAAQAFVANARAQLDVYTDGCNKAFQTYKDALKTCCVANEEEEGGGLWDWITGWF